MVTKKVTVTLEALLTGTEMLARLTETASAGAEPPVAKATTTVPLKPEAAVTVTGKADRPLSATDVGHADVSIENGRAATKLVEPVALWLAWSTALNCIVPLPEPLPLTSQVTDWLLAGPPLAARTLGVLKLIAPMPEPEQPELQVTVTVPL